MWTWTGHVDLAFQPATGGVQVEGDQLVLPATPGLGLELTDEWRDAFDRAPAL